MNSFGYRPWREAIALKSRIGVTDQPIPNKGLPAWVPSKSIWIYDINGKSWSKGSDLPTARGALTATAHENRILRDRRGQEPELFDPGAAADRAGGEYGDERGARYRDRHLVGGGAYADGA
jgi:hypothetical protein